MHENEFNIIFGTTRRKSATKEYVCEIGETLQESSTIALFVCEFLIFKARLSRNK